MSSRLPVFWERVDAMLLGTNLGGEYYVNRRLEIFKKQLFKEEEDMALQKYIRENKMRVLTGKPRTAFEFKLTDLQKDAVDLIATISAIYADTTPDFRVFASEVKNEVEKTKPDKLQARIVKDASDLSEGTFKLISPMIEKIGNYNVMDFQKVCDEAYRIMVREEAREEKSWVEEVGDFYQLRVPVSSSYTWGTGWKENDVRDEFEKETEKLLPVGDWKFKKSTEGCNRLINGRNEVYIHPMEFVVFAKERPLKQFLSHLKTISADTFEVQKFDIKEASVVKDASHREIYNEYKKMEKAIRTQILQNLKRYPYRYELAEKTYDKFRIENIADNNYTIHHSTEIGWMFTEDLVKKMVKEKVLNEDKKGRLSLNCKEIVVENNKDDSKKRVRD